MKRVIIGILVALAAASSQGCDATTQNGGKGSGGRGGSGGGVVAGLRTFETCSDLGDYLTAHAGTKKPSAHSSAGGAPEAAADTGSGGAAGAASPTASTSPIGVEEADLVKQEGNRLYVINSDELLTYDLTDAAHPRRIGRYDLGLSAWQIYADGMKVVVLGFPTVTQPVPMDHWGPSVYDPKAKIVVLDTTNASAPTILKTLELKGSYVDSRKVGGSVYVALQSWIEYDPTVDMEQKLAAKSPCDQVYVPEDLDNGDYETFSSWDVVGLNLNSLQGEPEMVSIIGAYASTVYATPSHFYVTDFSYESNETEVYLLELDPATGGVQPRSNAVIPGSVVNQFSMDETDGVFRIATTQQAMPVWIDDVPMASTASEGLPMASLDTPPPQPQQTKNYISTFRVGDHSLTQLGQIDTIVPGESITAARFSGNRAFVTTFVYQDPLVVVDLANPAAPAVAGELHLPGSTSHLQVWGDRVIAIASENAFWGNVILNLFDVSDIHHPTLVEQKSIPDSTYSEAQYEHKAFAFFEDRAILAIPVETTMGSRMQLYRVDPATGFSLVGSVDHDDLIPVASNHNNYSPSMRRALENGLYLYTVSDAGLKANAFGDLATDLFGEMFPGFTVPEYYPCGCVDDACYGCALPD